jgi:hypothetical protein
VDAKTPFGNIQIPFLNAPKNDQQQGHPELPKLPFDLGEITKPGNLLNTATETYCATQHPELYTYAAIGGAVASGTLLLSAIGLTFLIGKMVKTLRGRA